MSVILSDSILLKELKVYQWIFSLFGLNFPPVLLYNLKKDFKYYIILVIYFIYSIILICFVFWAAYVHNIIVKDATDFFHLDSMTEILTYIQNIGMFLLQLLMEYKTWFRKEKLKEILFFIQKLELQMLNICPVIFKQQKLRIRLFLSTGLSLIILISLLVMFNYYLVAGNMNLNARILVIFFLMSVHIKFLEYGCYIQIIYEYLIMLRNSLICLQEECNQEKFNWKMPRDSSLKTYYWETLKSNRLALLEFWYLVYKLEKYFGGSLFLLIFFNGIVILCTVSWAYVQYLYAIDSMYQIGK